MKVSLNLAQEFSNVDLKSIPRNVLLKRIGAQLGAVEEVIDWAPKFEGSMIIRVVKCEKHPNADKLSVCRIDDGGISQNIERGDDGLIQIVCGAPNVHADMYAVWLPVGATVPKSRESDPFVLTAREIRGVVSNGMLASASELGISEDHEGIVEVKAEEAGKEPVAGEPLTAYFGLDDFVIECENKMFTHRPDCFGNLGIARELAGISGLEFQSPDWYLNIPQFESKGDLTLEVKNDISELVPRFMAVAMQKVSVHPSPMWLQATLARVGIKPINNIVDVTNYVMHLTGQPLHAFDYDKLVAHSEVPTLKPRKSKKGEKLTLLGQKEITLTGEEVVIATDKQAVGLAGVMGGAETEVDENTKNIVIEAATFDMYNVRRTSMRHGLFTDAATRFTKGQSPRQNDRVLAFAMQKLYELAGAEQASNVFDKGQKIVGTATLNVTGNYINERLGTEMVPAEMARYLRNVEFQTDIVNDPKGAQIILSPPFWRMDIEQPEDVVEEVGRLHGFDRLPVKLPKRMSKPAAQNKLLEFKQQLRLQLKAAGANEVLTYSFVHGNLLRKTGTDPERWAYHIRNAISPDLQYYRTSLIPSLLTKVHPNIKSQAGDDKNQFVLFEIGKAHVTDQKENGLPLQMERLAVVIAADDKTSRVRQMGAAYYQAKKYLDAITKGQVIYSPLDNTDYPITAPYQMGRSALINVGGEIMGVIGEYNTSVRKQLKLPDFTAGFELDIEALQKYLKTTRYQPLPHFPGTWQDYTHEVTSVTPLKKIQDELTAALSQSQGYLYTVKPINIFQALNPKNSYKRLTFRVYVHHPERTLTTAEVTERLVAATRILRYEKE
ncbi:MAG: phenylalanine--tRNA ligase subunit beta [bacterium]|nr:phenylalanine--tRNA ligase subunit beta [bacterium]